MADLRNDTAFALLCRRFRNLLPAGQLVFFFFCVQLHHAALRRDGNHRVSAQLHRLLDHQLHLVRFGQTLKKIDPGRQFQPFLFDKAQRAENLILTEAFDSTAVFLSIHAVADGQLLARLHTKHIFNVVHIASRDPDRFSLYLFRLYKKLVHAAS